jgi:hypothetical protein
MKYNIKGIKWRQKENDAKIYNERRKKDIKF